MSLFKSLTKGEKVFLGFTLTALLLHALLILTFPLITLWAINTLLFPLFSIPYSFSTYVATLVVNWILMGSHVVSYSKIINKI